MTPPGRPSAAFTLVEVLVVVAIIATLVGLATLSLELGGEGRERQQARDRLGQALALAHDQAQLSGRPRALEMAARGYRFLQPAQEPAVGRDEAPPPEVALREGGWTVVETPRALAPRDLPAQSRAVLYTDGDRAGLPQRLPDSPAPQVVLWPDGSLTPFSADVARTEGPAPRRDRLALTGAATGRLAGPGTGNRREP